MSSSSNLLSFWSSGDTAFPLGGGGSLWVAWGILVHLSLKRPPWEVMRDKAALNSHSICSTPFPCRSLVRSLSVPPLEGRITEAPMAVAEATYAEIGQ